MPTHPIIDHRAARARRARARANGALSRGPKTPAGKARSAQNARKHGLTAAQPANPAALQIDPLEAEHTPQTDAERSALHLLADACHQLRHLQQLELNEWLKPTLGSFRTLLLYARYRATHTRRRTRAALQLAQLQNQRFARHAPYSPATHDLPPFVSTHHLRQIRMQYYDRRQLDPHQPALWPPPPKCSPCETNPHPAQPADSKPFILFIDNRPPHSDQNAVTPLSKIYSTSFQPVNSNQTQFQPNAMLEWKSRITIPPKTGEKAMQLDNLPADFESYRQRYLEELLPAGHTESELCEHYIFACFQLDRVRARERQPGVETGEMLNLARYRASLERSRDRAYKQFREIQNERYQRNAPYSAPTNDLPPFVKAAALRRVRMEYAFDHQVDPHVPEVWPYTTFAQRLPPPGFNTSTVDYPPKTVYERESPFPKPTLKELENELNQPQKEAA